MWHMVDWKVLEHTFAQHLPADWKGMEVDSCGGGCINEAYRLRLKDGSEYFAKLNHSDKLEMFSAEAEGLAAMAGAGMRVPDVKFWGQGGGKAFLVLQSLPLRSRDAQSDRALGKMLATMHRTQSASHQFGWGRENTIGETPQINDWTENWADFWAVKRLQYQLHLAEIRAGEPLPLTNELLDAIPRFLDGHRPVPSLLHGDLWGGNAEATMEDGKLVPYVFDPACYFGDRECDLSFTEMFGGFSPEFYEGYKEEWPIDDGYESRRELYNLYHILNHYHLFGGGYGRQAHLLMEVA